VKATVKSDLGMELLLDASLSELSEDAELLARLQFSGDRWDWVSRLIPVISDFNGAINADVRAGGVLRSPDLRGEVNWVDGSLAVPGLNLPLTEIGLTLTGSNAGDMTVTGTARSGEGLLRVSGVLDDVVSAAPSFNIRLSGDRVTLLNWEDYLLIASPDLEFAGDTSGVHVTGRVAMDEAEINVRELPEGAVTPSDDVQVVGRESEASRKTRITGAVEILLSEDVHLQAFGLDTNLEGQLNFIVDEGRDPRGMGELRLIGGVFKAYGQQLEIETGTMTFTGALDDPLINVRAVRNIENLSGKIVAGINLSGRAQEIQSTLFSDPSMSQADILSYLVIGRPLDEATAADGSNLSNSAYALGLRQAATIVNQVGQSVGLDELSVSGSNQNTTELIAGKQINSDLYARYVYGVFSQVGKLLLRYKLTESFSVEIGANRCR
jgi:translocation and assembly module TamB